ncbi:hypothetical protein JHW43_003849 [Diplocarpon mali]|nr:hypothetical protein JHW43_003849 [Diplocarpon mali]
MPGAAASNQRAQRPGTHRTYIYGGPGLTRAVDPTAALRQPYGSAATPRATLRLSTVPHGPTLRSTVFLPNAYPYLPLFTTGPTVPEYGRLHPAPALATLRNPPTLLVFILHPYEAQQFNSLVLVPVICRQLFQPTFALPGLVKRPCTSACLFAPDPRLALDSPSVATGPLSRPTLLTRASISWRPRRCASVAYLASSSARPAAVSASPRLSVCEHLHARLERRGFSPSILSRACGVGLEILHRTFAESWDESLPSLPADRSTDRFPSPELVFALHLSHRHTANMPAIETVTVLNKSGKVISTGKHLVNIFKDAKQAYQFKKAELKADHQARIQWKNEQCLLQSREEARSTSSSRHSHRSRSHRHRERDPANPSRPPLTERHLSKISEGSATSSRRSRSHQGSRRATSTHGQRSLHVVTDFEHPGPGLQRRHSEAPSTSGSRAAAYPSQHLWVQPRAHSNPEFHADDDIDMNLAYGKLPPDLLVTGQDEAQKEVALQATVTKLDRLLLEANCVQHSATAIISNLQANPEAMAAVALTLAELSNILKTMSPKILAALKSSSPAAFGLLASPQFLIAGGLALGVTVVMFGGYQIVKKIQASNEAEKRAHRTEEAMVYEGTEFGSIETWRRGIADVEVESVATSVDGELITPEAARQKKERIRDKRREERRTKRAGSAVESVRSERTIRPVPSKSTLRPMNVHAGTVVASEGGSRRKSKSRRTIKEKEREPETKSTLSTIFSRGRESRRERRRESVVAHRPRIVELTKQDLFTLPTDEATMRIFPTAALEGRVLAIAPCFPLHSLSRVDDSHRVHTRRVWFQGAISGLCTHLPSLLLGYTSVFPWPPTSNQRMYGIPTLDIRIYPEYPPKTDEEPHSGSSGNPNYGPVVESPGQGRVRSILQMPGDLSEADLARVRVRRLVAASPLDDMRVVSESRSLPVMITGAGRRSRHHKKMDPAITAALLESKDEIPFRAVRSHTQSTWARTFHSSPELYIQPQSIQEVEKVVNLARRCRRRVATVGCGHSPSDLACTSSWLVNLDNFNKLVSVDKQSCVVVMQSGIRLFTLGEELDKVGLAMPNLGSINHQSIAGAISTGTHGSTLRHGILSQSILSLKITLANGKTESCSAAEKPDLFRAALLSLGALGIIVEVTFQAVPAFTLAWQQVVDTDATMLNSWEEDLWTRAEFVRVWWFPYTRRAVVWTAEKTALAPRPPPKSYYDAWLGYHVYHNLLYLAQYVPRCLPWIEWFVFGMQYGFAAGSRTSAIQKSREALLMNCLYSQFVNEWAIPLHRGPEALRRLGSWLNRLTPSDPDYVPHGIPYSAEGLYVHAPVEVRVTETSDSTTPRPHLDPTFTDEATLYLNATLYRPYDSDPPCHYRYYQGFEYLMRALGGRPHWAKNFACTGQDIEEMYGPRLQEWRRVRGDADPEGMFVGEWHRRFIMGDGPRLALEEREVGRENLRTGGVVVRAGVFDSKGSEEGMSESEHSSEESFDHLRASDVTTRAE